MEIGLMETNVPPFFLYDFFLLVQDQNGLC